MLMRRKCIAHRANVFGKFMIYDAQSLSIYDEGTPTGEIFIFYAGAMITPFSAQGFIASCPNPIGVRSSHIHFYAVFGIMIIFQHMALLGACRIPVWYLTSCICLHNHFEVSSFWGYFNKINGF